MSSPPAPVQVGDLRRHPKGHTLRVRKIVDGVMMPYAWAECAPDPPVRGRRITNISTETVSKFPLVVEAKPEPDPSP
jgi:hypothetical protein